MGAKSYEGERAWSSKHHSIRYALEKTVSAALVSAGTDTCISFDDLECCAYKVHHDITSPPDLLPSGPLLLQESPDTHHTSYSQPEPGQEALFGITASSVADPRCLSRIKGQKDSGSRIRIRIKDFKYF